MPECTLGPQLVIENVSICRSPNSDLTLPDPAVVIDLWRQLLPTTYRTTAQARAWVSCGDTFSEITYTRQHILVTVATERTARSPTR